MQIGFSVLATALSSLVAGFGGEGQVIPPEVFDPTAKRRGRETRAERGYRYGCDSEVVHCGPNQMARLMSGMVQLI